MDCGGNRGPTIRLVVTLLGEIRPAHDQYYLSSSLSLVIIISRHHPSINIINHHQDIINAIILRKKDKPAAELGAVGFLTQASFKGTIASFSEKTITIRVTVRCHEKPKAR